MSDPFVPFGAAHLSAIAISFVLPVVLARFALGSGARDESVRLGIVALMIANRLLWVGMVADEGWVSWQNVLPLHLCDWAAIAAGVALVWPKQKPFELAYFWAFGGTLQAILTPELAAGFPDLRFIVFFVSHGTVIAAVIYLLATRGLRPTLASFPRVAAWSLFYMTLALGIDMIAGTNFGYLRFKPFTHTMFDYMAAWPWYLVELVAVGAASLLIYYSPFLILDLWRSARQPRSNP